MSPDVDPVDPASTNLRSWPAILKAVQTPLSLLALAFLVGGAGLAAFAIRAEGTAQVLGVAGIVFMLLLCVGAAYSMASPHRSAENARFREQLAGSWWERIYHPAGSALSFFTITDDPLKDTVLLEGRSYGADGHLCATWESEVARLYATDRKILYLWCGTHPIQKEAHLNFHGMANLIFDPPTEGSTRLTQGHGKFWDVDENNPRNTTIKPVELRRVTDKSDRKIMTSGSTEEKREVILRVITKW